MAKVKVVLCYTGGVGRQIIRLLAGHPTLQLVGVLVHHEDKAGVDAGTIAGIAPLGVPATRELDALLASGADIALWHGAKWEPQTVARLLRAGIDVYSGIGGWYLPGQPEQAELEAAAQAGGSTLVAGGNIPGLITDVLPLFVSGFTGRVRQVRVFQRGYNAHYPSALQLSQGCGFGIPVAENQAAAAVDAMWLWGLSQSARLVADGLGLPFDGLAITAKEYGLAPEAMTLAPSGLHIPAGTPAGVRTTFTATSDGRPFLVIVNEQVARLGLGPGWRQDEATPNWRVEIDGSPDLVCEIKASTGSDGVDHAAALNAARAVNFIPRVVAAAPGCRTVLDLPAPRAASLAR